MGALFMIGRRDGSDGAAIVRNPAGQPPVSIGLLAAMLVLGLLALVYFIWPAYRAFLPLQIENGGAWNAYHADTIRAGALSVLIAFGIVLAAVFVYHQWMSSLQVAP